MFTLPILPNSGDKRFIPPGLANLLFVMGSKSVGKYSHNGHNTRLHFIRERICISLLKALNASAEHPVSHDILVNLFLMVLQFENREQYLKLVLKRLPLSRNSGRLNELNVDYEEGADLLLVNRTSFGSFYLSDNLNLMRDELNHLTDGFLPIELDVYKENVCELLLDCCNDNFIVRKDLLEKRAKHVVKLLSQSLFSFRGYFVRTIRDCSTSLDMISIVRKHEGHHQLG